MGPGPIGKLLDIATELGYDALWVYWRLTPENQYTVNFPLLHEIGRQRGYKPGWSFVMSKKIKNHKSDVKKFREVMG